MMSPRPVCLLLSLLAAALVLASPATAGSCGQKIIDDWADDGSPGVDGTYPISCYRDAIAALPEDLRSYSSAADDIERALQERLRAEDESGDDGGGSAGGGGGGSSSGGEGGPPEDAGGSETPGETASDEREPAASTDSGQPAQTAPGAAGDTPATPVGESAAAAPATDLLERDLGDGAGSLPVPVIAVLALAGLAALIGAGWLVRRQLQGRQRPAD